MKLNGILNSDISKVLSDLGHTDWIVIGDAGLPVPEDVKKIDLSLKIGIPSFVEVLQEIVLDMEVESVIVAEEIKKENTEQLKNIEKIIGNKPIHFVSHAEFKIKTRFAKTIIRTGEATPFSNIILQAGVIF
ncbi:D-ribose pyranase [Bacillus sp. FJAT-50079]|uniref:D-ribose pyranase n=1 Tax=Bacillus sp. FJAT-50079 TaxID=2833577 RepID=UPI001BCA0BFE|nr:D-ribose pyranase [Bacillus sp. FJAT-50079]MBS4208156.1 D-ribose pyranase [Bacillus sp. FJAT-50079]